MSHELFHDVTDSRPRATRARGGTLFLSILAHALILGAVIVVPLLAADALPAPTDVIGVFRFDPPPPPDPPRPLGHPQPTPAGKRESAIPIEAPDAIQPEQPRPPVADYSLPVVGPTGPGFPDGVASSVSFDATPPTAPPPPTPPKPVRLSAVDMPRKLHDVAPIYPEIARRTGVEGVVIIEAVIATDGGVRDARVLRSQPLLDRAALDAVRQWRYAPTRVNGVAVPVIVTVTVQFRLQR